MIVGVLGASGRLGTALTNIGAVPLVCDITNVGDVRNAVAQFRPDVIINCAAVTDVDRCEGDLKEKAIRVHIRGVSNIIDASWNIPIIHISTDFIFDGTKQGQYVEFAHDNPINAYGLSKNMSEIVLRSSTHKYTIVRTTQIYGSHKEDFGNLMANNFMEGRQVWAFSDVYGNPTNVKHLALGIKFLWEIYGSKKRWTLPKVINIAGLDWLSRSQFALMVANELGVSEKLVQSSSIDDVEMKAKRPKKAGLCLKFASFMGVPLFSARDGIKEMIKI